jgi:hypothetical protein
VLFTCPSQTWLNDYFRIGYVCSAQCNIIKMAISSSRVCSWIGTLITVGKFKKRYGDRSFPKNEQSPLAKPRTLWA